MSQLTTAPDIHALEDLAAGWRRVCVMQGKLRHWFGVLEDGKTRRTYQRMLEDGHAICVQRKEGGQYHVYAKMAQEVPIVRRPLAASETMRW